MELNGASVRPRPSLKNHGNKNEASGRAVRSGHGMRIAWDEGGWYAAEGAANPFNGALRPRPGGA